MGDGKGVQDSPYHTDTQMKISVKTSELKLRKVRPPRTHIEGEVMEIVVDRCCVLFLHVNLVIANGARGLRRKPPINAVCVIRVKALNGSDPVPSNKT